MRWVETCWDHDQVWLKLPDYREKRRFTRIDVVFIRNQLFWTLLFVDWEINIEANAGIRTYSLWIALAIEAKEFVVFPSMDGNEENAVVFVEDLRGAVSHVDVPVNDADFLNSEIPLGNPSSYWNIIKEAKAIDFAAASVVAWRPYYGESWIDFLVGGTGFWFFGATDGFHCLDCATGC